jgi:hypothetical protein
MSETPERPMISEQQLALFRRCRFEHQIFRPRDCYRSIEPPEDFMGFVDEWGERGDDLLEDTARFEVIEGGWDHEHCDVCWARVENGVAYWPNVDEQVGQVDLCDACYPRVMDLLRSAPEASPESGI